MGRSGEGREGDGGGWAGEVSGRATFFSRLF